MNGVFFTSLSINTIQPLATHLIHKAGYKKFEARMGAVTLIQRFGGSLNLNIHFHMIFLDGGAMIRAPPAAGLLS